MSALQSEQHFVNRLKMAKNLKDIDLYFINDSRLTKKNNTADIRAAVKGGVKIVQYREKEKSTKDMVSEAKEMKKVCDKKGALFLVNDRVDVCLAVDADGVHLGNDDMPYEAARRILGAKIIGLTVHDAGEAADAEKKGADYIGVSPIFETKTKPDAGKPAGLGLIEEVKNRVKIPVVAIGGINKENLASVIKAGADSAVAISAIVTKDDVEKEVKGFIEMIRENKK